jgi:hypothetical protein
MREALVCDLREPRSVCGAGDRRTVTSTRKAGMDVRVGGVRCWRRGVVAGGWVLPLAERGSKCRM